MIMIDFVLNEKFLIPFLSTLGASLTIYRTCKWKKANEREQKFIVCTTTPD